MESSAPAAVPWIVLAVALLALAGLAAAWLVRRRARPRAAVAPAEEPALPAPATRYPDDDLPGFLDTPPGMPRTDPAPPVPAAVVAPAAPPAERRDGPGPGQAVAVMAAATLLLIGALAAVALAGRENGAPAAGSASRATPPPATRPAPAPPLPELPGVPAHPLPGESGAGALATRSVPLGEDGVTARLTFGGIVLERHAVGVTVAHPSLSVTTTGEPGDDAHAALAHLRLETWNCLAVEVPADPEGAGCVRSTVEYADLPAPALGVTRDGEEVRITGRFPTYTRPNGTAPVYTGRSYELTASVRPAGPVRDSRADAEATLFLGTDRVGTRDEPGLNVVRYAG
ncbi:hypothetical protein [Geodermatophilus ruber]|nr:hypothetical protein [Geodermatophilus ruber]